MATKQKHIYGEVESKTDLRDVFLSIRKDVEDAGSRADLTELYRRAGYLVSLTSSPAWKKKFEGEVREIRSVAEEEFARTARAINRRAEDVGTDGDYDEKWGD